MRRITPVYSLALIILLAAGALAVTATPLHLARAAATPAVALRYSTVGSCACEVLPTATLTPTIGVLTLQWFAAGEPIAPPATAPTE